MNQKNYISLYSISIPIWFILLIPYSWPVLLILSFIIDSILLIISFAIVEVEHKKTRYKSLIGRIFIFGTIGDVIGYLVLFLIMPISSNINLGKNPIIQKISSGVMDSPYNNGWSILWVILSYSIGVCFSYFLYQRFVFSKVDLDDKKKRFIGILLAVLSGPFLGFLS